MTYRILGLLFPLVVALCSCNKQQSAELTEVKSELAATKTELNGVRTQLTTLEGRIFRMELTKDVYKSTSFDVAEPGGFQRLETNTGTLLVSLKDAQPYLNGYRLNINIGNPSSVTYNGFKMKVKWGKAFKEGADFDQWQKSLQEKELSFVETLAPGTWNPTVVHLAPATADELGTLELSMTTELVSLRRR
jgi:hypothetical protein